MKTSLHVQRIEGHQAEFARRAGWIKVVDPPLDTPIFPEAEVVVVRFWDDDHEPAYLARGYQGGVDFVRDNMSRWRRVQAARCLYELPNEPECNTNEGLLALNAFTLGAIDEASKHGVTLVGLNLAEGNPNDDGTGSDKTVVEKWQKLLACIRALAAGGHYMGRHCYWRPGVEGPTGRYHALGRLKWDLDVLDTPKLQVLVTEMGVDGGIAGNPPKQGWRVFLQPADYAAQVAEAEAFLQAMPQVRAGFLFTSGYNHPWETYEHDQSICQLILQKIEGSMVKLQWPLHPADIVRIIQRFDPPRHYGLDLSCYEGSAVYASVDGVAYRGDQGSVGFGRYIRIESNGWYVYTAHLRDWLVESGTPVKAGQLIGASGNTGNSTGPHLHFEARRGSRDQSAAVDPEPLLGPLAPPQPVEHLPTTDPLTTSAASEHERYEKVRWWLEEMQRTYETGDEVRAERIRLSLIEQMYKWEGEG